MARQLPQELQRAATRLYETGLSICQVSQQLNISTYGCRCAIRRQGGHVRSRALSTTVQQKAGKLYETGLSLRQVSQQLGISKRSCGRAVHRFSRARPPKHCQVDGNFFDKINTEAKAYWLGFLTADGHVSDLRVRLELANRDGEHVRRFAAALSSTYAVTSTRACIRTAIYSPKLVKRLRHLGLLKNKSKTARPAAIPTTLVRHYWRGLVDGDGSIDDRSGFGLQLYGTKAIVVAFADFMYRHTGGRVIIRPTSSIWVARLFGKAALEVGSLLYMGSTVALPRKERVVERNLGKYEKDMLCMNF